MGRPRKVPPYLVQENGQWYIIDGKRKIDVGRSKRHAERLLAEHVSK